MPRHPHPVIDRLRAAAALPSDAAVSRRLGLNPFAVRDCRRDGHIPYGSIVTAVRAGVLAVDLHWLFTGQCPSRDGNVAGPRVPTYGHGGSGHA